MRRGVFVVKVCRCCGQPTNSVDLGEKVFKEDKVDVDAEEFRGLREK